MTVPAVQLSSGHARQRWRGPATGVGVFVAIMIGWVATLWWSAMAEARSPLPDGGGAQGRCAVWFVGSSSIARWPMLQGEMKPWHAHNRGILGASIRQIVPRFTNESGVAAPSAIVFYAGDNDIAHGETVAAALDDMRSFLAEKDRRFPRVPVLLLSVKYSPARWGFRHDITAYNKGLQLFAAQRRNTFYVDVASSLLVDGRPGDYFESDGIHLRAPAYVRWDRPVLDALDRDARDATACAGRPGPRA